MPRTKQPDTGRFRDACYFATREMRCAFDLAVLNAYDQQMGFQQRQEPEHGLTGMRM